MMFDEYVSHVLLALCGVALFAVVWGLLGVIRGRRGDDTTDNGKLGEVLRAEHDRQRQFLDQQSKAMRQELGETVNALKEANAKSLGELQQNLGARMEGISAELDSRVKELGERRMAVSADGTAVVAADSDSDGAAARAVADLRQEVASTIERLQEKILATVAEQRAAQAEQIEGLAQKLAVSADRMAAVDSDGSIAKQGEAVAELRHEVAATMERLHDRLLASAQEQRTAQAEQIDGLAQRISALAPVAGQPAASGEGQAPPSFIVSDIKQDVAATIERLQDRLLASVQEQRATQAEQFEGLAQRLAAMTPMPGAARSEEAAAASQALVVADIKQEVAATIERLHDRLLSTVQEQRNVQAEQLEGLAQRIAATTAASSQAIADSADRSAAQASALTDVRQQVADAIERLQDRVLGSVQEQRSAHAAQLEGLADRIATVVKDSAARDEVKGLLDLYVGEQRAVQNEHFETLVRQISETANGVGRQGEGVRTTLDRRLQELAAADEARHRALVETIEARLDKLADGGRQAVVTSQQETAAELARISNATKDTLTAMTALRTQRIDSVKKSLDTLTERQEKSQDALRQTVENKLEAMGNANAARLEEIQDNVERQLRNLLDERIGNSVRMLDAQFDQLRRALGDMQHLAGDFGEFKRVLTGARSQGVFGEVDLPSLVARSFTTDQYVSQPTVGHSGGPGIDIAIKLPGRDGQMEMLLPVSARFSGSDYADLMQAVARNDGHAAERAGDRLEQSLRNFARELGSHHVEPPETTDIAVAYLPSEGMYAEVLRRPGLVEQIQQQHRVVVAGPTTLQAMLNAFRMVIRAVAIQKRSTEVWQLLGDVRGELDRNGTDLAELQQHLAASLQSVDSIRARGGSLRLRLQEVERLDNDNIPTLLGIKPMLQEAAE